MNVVFFGTAEFGIPSLEAIRRSRKHTLVAAVTGPDKPRGRGLDLQPTPIGKWLADAGTGRVLKPANLRDPAFAKELQGITADAYVVVAYRILPESVFTIPRYAFNLHASLLPAYRGAAPIQRAIMAGEKTTGVTTFMLQKNVDTGAIIDQIPCSIPEAANAGDMFESLSEVGAELVIRTLDLLEIGEFTTRLQDETKATPAPKLTDADLVLDFSRRGIDLINQARGLAPRPGAHAVFRENPVKILALLAHNDASLRGRVGEIVAIDKSLGPIVQAGEGLLAIGQIQPAGKRPITGAEFARGYHPETGETFQTPQITST
jgi:methionyl-tRNA formyltransferase